MTRTKIKSGDHLMDALAQYFEGLEIDDDVDVSELSIAMVQFAAGFCYAGYDTSAVTTPEQVSVVCKKLMQLFESEFKIFYELEQMLRDELRPPSKNSVN